MTKQDLEAYTAICAEIEQLNQEIDRESRDIVADSVQASSGPGCTMGLVVIQGVSDRAFREQQRLLAQLREKRLERISQRNEIEAYIGSLKDVQLAVILRARYVQDKSWRDVAKDLGGGNTEDSVRKRTERFFEKI